MCAESEGPMVQQAGPPGGRDGRVRVHGGDPLAGVAGRAAVLRPAARPPHDRRRRPHAGRCRGRGPQARVGGHDDRLAHPAGARRRRPRRHLHAGQHARRDRDRGARGRQARAVREAAGQLRRRRPRRWSPRPSGPRRRASASMVGFTYRRVPAIALARELVAEGRIGTVRHVRAAYLQDWIADEQTPRCRGGWTRSRRGRARSGTSGRTSSTSRSTSPASSSPA